MNRRTVGLGLAAAAIGTAAAGVAVGRRAQRRVVGRVRSVPDRYADEPFGSLHSDGRTVLTDDGVRLHVEVDGAADDVPTILFVHGFTLSMDCWHFQHRDLRDLGRLVFYDQRSHGASGRGRREHATIDQLGRDLHAVLDAVAPTGPVVVIGHSMGGMTLLALADQHPELFGRRIVGVGLLGTAAGTFADTILGIPGFVGRALRPVAPGVIRVANQRAHLIEQGRRGTDLEFLATKWLSYGGDVPPSLIAFMEHMVAATPVEVMTEFFDTFLSHDKLHALPVLRAVESLVICGERDRLTPAHNSRAMAEALPTAELIIAPGAGHMVMLERPALVNDAIRRLVERSMPGTQHSRSA